MKASAEAFTVNSSQKSKTGGPPLGPSATQELQPMGGSREAGAPLLYARAAGAAAAASAATRGRDAMVLRDTVGGERVGTRQGSEVMMMMMMQN
jgi:hypothetical protein